jgi:hypothetical protein
VHGVQYRVVDPYCPYTDPDPGHFQKYLDPGLAPNPRLMILYLKEDVKSFLIFVKFFNFLKLLNVNILLIRKKTRRWVRYKFKYRELTFFLTHLSFKTEVHF